MKNPMTFAVIGAAFISILLGIAGANYEPKGDAFGKENAAEQTEATSQTESSTGEVSGEQGDAASVSEQ